MQKNLNDSVCVVNDLSDSRAFCMTVDISKTAESQQAKQQKHPSPPFITAFDEQRFLSLPCGRLERVNIKGEPELKTIRDFVNAVRKGTAAKQAAIDEFAANGKTEKYDNLKLGVPAWVMGGANGKNNETIIPNGFISLDVDHISRGYAAKVKESLCKLPFVGLCCLSLSKNGVFALIYAPSYVGNADAIKSEIYGDIDVYLKAKHKPVTFDIDEKCTDTARRRFESFDTDIYVSNDIKPYERTGELMGAAWNSSRIKSLALLFGYDDIKPNHAAVGSLLALTAASARLSLWDRSIFDETKTYQVRIGAVILGQSGGGKGDLLGQVREIAHALGVSIQNHKTTASMAQGVSLACNTQEPDALNPKLSVWRPKMVKDVQPIIEINDEDYAAREVAKQATYAMDKLAERRKILDRIYEPQSTKKDSLPTYGFTASYQYLCVSQPDSFADAIKGERTDTGDGRRELVCELPEDEQAPAAHFADRLFIADMNRHSADLQGITFALQTAYNNHTGLWHITFESMGLDTVKTDELARVARGADFGALNWHNLTNCQFTFMRCVKAISTNESEAMDAKTHLANIAAIECYLSGRKEMTPRDILTAAAITGKSFELRRRIQERCDELTAAESLDKTLQALEKYWDKNADGVNTANYCRWKSNHGVDARKNIVIQWESANLIEYYERNNKKTRRATPAELDDLARDLELAMQIGKYTGAQLNTLAAQWDKGHERSEHYSPNWKRPQFDEDTPDAQRIRVYEMINKCVNGNKCGQFVKGERQSTLYRVSNVMMSCGMWGPVAKDVLTEIGRGCGLPDKEIKHALRDKR